MCWKKTGEHDGKLDLKTKGLVPFVDFARVMALRHGIAEANTQERLQGVAEGGHLSTDLYQKASQLMKFRWSSAWPIRTGNGNRA